MNIAEVSIRCRVITWAVTAVVTVGGYVAYQQLGRLEDPEFTIKEAQVFTRYPGASAMEVAEEVTDEVETAIQQMGDVEYVKSISEAGLSTVRVVLWNTTPKERLPQVWDELRRKVTDMQGKLPPGTSTSIVNDDFGDVYGIFIAIYGDGYDYAELKQHADTLRRELLLADDVGKIAIYGDQPETVYVEISRAKLAQLGVSLDLIEATLKGQNLVVESGKAAVGPLDLRISPTGELRSVQEIGELLILQPDGRPSSTRLRDIATISRGYADPPKATLRINGRPAIGLGVSTKPGGNVITMGRSLKERWKRLETSTPIGVEVAIIANQESAVTTAVDGFVISLVEAILIVVGVLMLAMGLRSGLLIGAVLLITVLATFIVMQMQGIMLERISLGALIIALGMLVDNAIVVVEGILVNQQRGMKPVQAAAQIVGQTMWPLLGATVIAVLAFAAIGASPDSTGEYCRSLFQVIYISLLASWVTAITITPLMGVIFLKIKPTKPGETAADPYGGLFFRGYRAFLAGAIRMRWMTVAVLLAMLAVSVFGFGFISKSFFPPSTRPQFMVHYWMPQGTKLADTDTQMIRLSDQIAKLEHVTQVATFAGQGALRFLLTYTPEEANTAYGMALVDVDDANAIGSLIEQVHSLGLQQHPDAQVFCRRFVLGPGDPAKIHARFRGPDPDTLRRLAAECRSVLTAEPLATDILDDWRDRVPMIRPVVAEAAARNASVTRSELADAMAFTFDGLPVGQYREGDDLLPIVARAPQIERDDIRNINDIPVYSPIAGRSIPIGQFVTEFRTASENSIVRRRNRLPTITVKCDPRVGEASATFAVVRPRVEQMFAEKTAAWNLAGYSLEWGGEYEDSGKAQKGLAGMLPAIGLLIVLTLVFLFNSIKKPLIILLTVPLAIIGVTAGLLLYDQPFGFMALLGFMSLAGMLIKNAIVLIDEINAQLATDKPRFEGLLEAGLSRLRPVSMAALTTVLGMIPLLADAFFISMAVTIMFGLTFATILTLVFVPVLYAIFFGIHENEPGPAAADVPASARA